MYRLRDGNRPDQLDADGAHLQVTRDGNRQASPRVVSPCRNGACVRQHATEAHAGCHREINVGQSDLWLGSWRSGFDR